MKLLMILNGHNVGGAELQFLELARYLAKRHDVHVISLQGDSAVKHIGLPAEIPITVFSYTKKGESLLMLLRAVMHGRKFRPDVVVSTSFIGNAVAFAVGSKLVSLQTVSKTMAYSAIDRFVLNRFKVLVAGCKDIEEYLLKRGHKQSQIEIVNNWVDFSTRTPTRSVEETRESFGIEAGKKIVGCIGRMHHQKGQEFLIRAFRRVAETRDNLKLVLVGDGPRMDEMKAEAKGHPDIMFTGLVQGDDYNNLLQTIDVYVQPSRFEGLPRTLLDAMFFGKPVIASAVNGHLDAVNDQVNGLLVEPEDETELYLAIKRLLGDPELAAKLGKNAARDAALNFSADTQMDKIDRLLT